MREDGEEAVLGVARRLGLGARLAVVDQRLHELGAAGLERLLGSARHRLVAKDLEQADRMRALGVAHRHHRAAAPEAAAVLPPVPALVGGAPFLERLLRLALRHAGDPVLLDEQHVAALADHFVGEVAGQCLGADVPARDTPLHVERHDRVLARVVDDQAQPLLRLAQLLLGVAAVADVEDDRDRAVRPVVGVEHGGDRGADPDDAAVAAQEPLLHLERRAVGGEAAERLLVLLPIVGMDEGEQRAADELLGNAPGDPRETGIDERDRSVEVDVADAGRRLGDDGAKERLRLAQRLADAAPLADVDEGQHDAADAVFAAAVRAQAREQPALAEAHLALDRRELFQDRAGVGGEIRVVEPVARGR